MPRNKPDNLENEITPTKNADINILAKKIQKLVDQVESISISNSTNDIQELTDTVCSLSDKIDNLAIKSEANHISVTDDIAHIRDNLIQGLKKSNKDMSKRITTMEQRILFLEKDITVSSQRMRENWCFSKLSVPKWLKKLGLMYWKMKSRASIVFPIDVEVQPSM